ncbi:hypothetical protein [Nonomuraea jabiensis]|uniref:hypothetical protein n=1 Tax=Nonomuraea jabiensis TaxID=882448 RepID=UPI003D75E4A8
MPPDVLEQRLERRRLDITAHHRPWAVEDVGEADARPATTRAVALEVHVQQALRKAIAVEMPPTKAQGKTLVQWSCVAHLVDRRLREWVHLLGVRGGWYFAGKAICGNPETIHGIVKDHTPGDEPVAKAPASARSFHPKITRGRALR